MLTDPEGTPLALLDITERSEPPAAAAGQDSGMIRLAGPVTGLREPEHGPFRRLMLRPADARAALGDGPVLAYATRGPVHSRQIGQLRHVAGQLKARLLLLPLITGPAQVVTRPEALIRAVLAAAANLPPTAMVIPVPLAARGPAGRNRTRAGTVRARAGRRRVRGIAPDDRRGSGRLGPAPQTALAWLSRWSALATGPTTRPPRYGGRSPSSRRARNGTTCLPASSATCSTRGPRYRRGSPRRPWHGNCGAPARRARRTRVRAVPDRPVRLRQVHDRTEPADALAERGDRKVTLLDGDLVRQLLSAGLTFSRADRDLNIVRIGFVAAEVARHGGIAICAPIAPYAGARARVRKMVSEVGDFLLIHVATPLEVCEARDRKGLYAKARAGIIDQFTGISDPYEEPQDADLVIDTSTATREQATEAVLRLLTSGGWLSPAQ